MQLRNSRHSEIQEFREKLIQTADPEKICLCIGKELEIRKQKRDHDAYRDVMRRNCPEYREQQQKKWFERYLQLIEGEFPDKQPSSLSLPRLRMLENARNKWTIERVMRHNWHHASDNFCRLLIQAMRLEPGWPKALLKLNPIIFSRVKDNARSELVTSSDLEDFTNWVTCERKRKMKIQYTLQVNRRRKTIVEGDIPSSDLPTWCQFDSDDLIVPKGEVWLILELFALKLISSTGLPNPTGQEESNLPQEESKPPTEKKTKASSTGTK
jgi:hypothetical protein